MSTPPPPENPPPTFSTATAFPQVVELVEGWNFAVAVEGTVGTRKFIDASALPNRTPITLPSIGSSFNDDWPLITCKKISCKYISPRGQCPIIYTCDYDAKPLWSIAGGTRPPKCTTNESIGADYITYTNPPNPFISGSAPNQTTVWSWLDANFNFVAAAPDVIIPSMEFVMTITKTRYIYPGQSLQSWKDATKALIGTINSGPVNINGVDQLDGCGAQTVLYMGADLTEAVNEADAKMWRAEMKFRYRFIPNPYNPGIVYTWNHVFDPITVSYRILGRAPYGTTSTPTLYATADFTPLFNSCQPPPTLGNNLPIGRLPPPTVQP